MGEKIRLRVCGEQKLSSEIQTREVSPFAPATIVQEVHVAFSARGIVPGAETVDCLADADTQVLELEFEGGIRQFINVAQLRDDLKKHNLVSRGADTSDVVEIPPDFGRSESRGRGDLALKVLRVLGVDPVAGVADRAVDLVLSSFEDKLDPAPGLYRIQNPNAPTGLISDAKELDGSGPYLLFLHGTASSIAGSFGGLSPSDPGAEGADWTALTQRYGNRILALQHKTFSESPVKNAIDVASLLPPGARLHLVSHSRGGLIGELLCMTDFQDWQLQAFENTARGRVDDFRREDRQRILELRGQEADNIKRLADVIRTKRFTVEKFVRVASPARGTILLSKRLDVYLSVLLNVIGLIPPLKASILYAFVKAAVLETARRRTDPRELPGIEAMMPESPLIHILNQQGNRSRADLAVISGDLDPDGIWRKLALLAVQALYWEDNDLVVNTKSMYGGMQRMEKAHYFFNRGPHVNHFHYFVNPGTRSRLRDWLLTASGVPVEGFAEFDPEQKKFTADRRRGVADSRPILFLLPDLMGSELRANDDLVWLSSEKLSRLGLGVLKSDLRPASLVPEYYAELFNSLSDEYQINACAYDWRKSLLETRDRLAQAVSECLKDGRRVAILGHGTGGTLALLLARNVELWSQFARQGGRLVMLGSPIRVSGFAGTLLRSTNRLNRLLNIVDQQSDMRAEALFRGFPGILELTDPSLLTQDEKSHGEELRRELNFQGPPENVVYVAGAKDQTPLATSDNGKDIPATSAGDGHVTWAEARVFNLPAWLMQVPHGNLVNPIAGLPAIRDLLSRGSTDRLSMLPGSPVVQDSVLTSDEPVLYPSDSDLADSALGGNTEFVFQSPQPPLRAWVSHGHLRHAEHPLMIGHYKDDSIVSAERVLDRALRGRLSSRFALGVYPGIEGTVEIVKAPGMYPRGAIVVGLGPVGEITSEKLRRVVTNALLRYVLGISEEVIEKGAEAAEERSEIGVSSLLVGAYGDLTLRESLTAIVKSVMQANRQLGTQKLDKAPRIGAIEFVDLYEDVAIEAAHELLELAERVNGDSSAGQTLVAEEFVRTVEGGQASRPLNPYQSGWWRRVSISDEKGILRFTVLTDRARAVEEMQRTQRALVDGFVRDAVGNISYDKQLSATLFQLLLPRNLREAAEGRVDTVLIVDRDSAKYPWELLAQRTRTDIEAYATQCGLLRQFRSLSNERRLSPASGRAVFVVGDTNSGREALRAAREEAEAVKRELGKSYDVISLPPDVDAQRLTQELISGEYRIVHFAAHGEFHPGDPSHSGVVIGKDRWLTPYELLSMPAAPDLAFINCCYLGGIETTSSGQKKRGQVGPELAANFAETLMNIGTRAVIVAGWAVYDPAGKVFAERFYQGMLAGKNFGLAVQEARQRVQELYSDKNTWGAYQCYGNPDFRLEQPPASLGGLGRNKRWYVSRLEIRQRVQDITALAAEVGEKEDKAEVRKELENLREKTPIDWRDGEVLGAFGKAYAALGDNTQAIICYQQALADETSSARVKFVQDLGNLVERAARSKPPESRDQDLKRAITLLEDLGKIIATGEQSSILAAFYKRQGQYAGPGAERVSAHQKALEYYDQAYKKRKELGHPELYYPGVNAAALAYVLRDAVPDKNADNAKPGYWFAVLAECIASAKAKGKKNPDFWSRVTPADALLVQSLWEKSVERRHEEVIAAYKDVINGLGQPFEFDSMLSQIKFLAGASEGTTREALDHIVDVLSRLIPR